MGFGTNLFQVFGKVPPSLAIAPISAFSMNSARDTCQPPSAPAAALRQTWVERRVPAVATTRATASMAPASTPDSFAANSKVYGA